MQLQEHLLERVAEIQSSAEMTVTPKRKVRVCIVTENFLPKIDGVTRTLARLLDHLRETGHEALVVGPDNGLTSYAGFTVRGTPGLPLFFYPELKWNFLSPSSLSKILSFAPDVLHFVDPILLGPQVILAAKLFLPHIPRVSSYHTNIALYAKHFGYPFLSPAIWSLQRYLHGQCSAIMCPSPSTRLTLLDHGFPDKIRIWHRGVDTQLFSPEKRSKDLRASWGAEGKVVLLYVGRVSWEKNLRCLARAYLEIWNRRRDVHLVVTGDGPARTELEGMFLDAKANVTFTGYLDGDNLATVYASSDIFTFPSKSETFGQVVLEAQASGIPVIAFRAEGVCDIIQDGRTGWLVPVASPATIMTNRSNRTGRTSMSPHVASEFEEMTNFEKVIYAAIEMEERRICAGLEAIRWARTWTWSEATEKAVDTFREVIC